MKFKVALCFVGFCLTCGAAGILDQTYSSGIYNYNAFLIYGGNTAVAQTFTAGLSGILGGINLDIYSYYPSGSYPLHITIRGTTAGVPNSSLLGETTLSVSGLTMDQFVTFPQNIPITAGAAYAISVNYAGPGGTAFGSWLGGDYYNVGYPGGSEFSWDGANWTAYAGTDGHFSTYVVVPEPGRLRLAGWFGLLAGLGHALRRHSIKASANGKTAAALRWSPRDP